MSDPSRAEPGGEGGAVSSEVLDRVFGALSHPTRRQILISLYARGGVMTAGEIADRFKHSWPTTTRHLGVLEAAGVVERSRDGRHRVYTLRRRPLLRVADWIYAWAALTDEDPGAGKRPGWTELPYARMRNAIPSGKKKRTPTPKKAASKRRKKGAQ